MRVATLMVGLGILLSSALCAADRETISVTWPEYQRYMERREIPASVRVFLKDGTAINTGITRVESEGIVVNSSRDTKPWDTSMGVARIPKSLIGRIQLKGRVGKRGLMGALIGLGVGAGLTAVTWAHYRGIDRESGLYNTAAVGAISMPAGALAGYLIGRFNSNLAPEFIIRANDSSATR